MGNCVQTTYCLIRDQLNSVPEKKDAIRQILNDSLHTSAIFTKALFDYSVKTGTNFSKIAVTGEYNLERRTWKEFVNVFGDDKDIMVPFGVELLKSNRYAQVHYLETIKKYEPDYELPQAPEPESKSGCYVATAVAIGTILFRQRGMVGLLFAPITPSAPHW
jgi:hypothetical protein